MIQSTEIPHVSVNFTDNNSNSISIACRNDINHLTDNQYKSGEMTIHHNITSCIQSQAHTKRRAF